jgi:hypothetical protein
MPDVSRSDFNNSSAHNSAVATPPVQFQYRLFASVDVIGSTGYKSSNPSRKWLETFDYFLSEFPNALLSQYGYEFDERLQSDLATYPRIVAMAENPAVWLTPWKFIGDEILFVTDIECHEQVAVHILVFMKAIKVFGAAWAEDTPPVPLRLKGAMWLAEFPITNQEVELDVGEYRLKDYIGPSIDAGFRVAKHAEEGRLMLSPDLALVMLDAVDQLEWTKEGEFFPVFHGREILKGVLQNNPYPLIYLHMDGGKPSSEERLLGIAPVSDWTRLRDYLRKYLDHHTPAIRRPFFPNDPDPAYRAVPVDLANELRLAYYERDEDTSIPAMTAELPPTDDFNRPPPEPPKDLPTGT